MADRIELPAVLNNKSLRTLLVQMLAKIEVLESNIKVGMSMEWSIDTDPDEKWMRRYGQVLLRSEYPELFAIIGTAFGDGYGDGLTFNIPDDIGITKRGHTPEHLITIVGSGTASDNNATFTSHELGRTGTKIRLPSGGGLLSGLTIDTTYYAIVVDDNTLAFATTYANALAGTKIAITGANTANLTVWEEPEHHANRIQAARNGNEIGPGTRQESDFESHTHTVRRNNSTDDGSFLDAGAGNGAQGTVTTNPTGGVETRGYNTHSVWVMRVKP